MNQRVGYGLPFFLLLINQMIKGVIMNIHIAWIIHWFSYRFERLMWELYSRIPHSSRFITRWHFASWACIYRDPLHFHHDGCPSCYAN